MPRRPDRSADASAPEDASLGEGDHDSDDDTTDAPVSGDDGALTDSAEGAADDPVDDNDDQVLPPRVARSEEQQRFDDASFAYLPAPAGVWVVMGGLFGGVVLSIVVYSAVAAIGGFSVTAPGGPGFSTGVAVGQLGAGEQLHQVRAMADLTIASQTLLQIPLWVGLMLPLAVITWMYGPGITRLMGLRLRKQDALIGLPIGVAAQVVVNGFYWLVNTYLVKVDPSEPARELIGRVTTPVDMIALVLLIGVGAPIFEEVFYRGLTLRMMERRIGSSYAVIASACLFAVMHAQEAPLPGLVLFGIVLGVMTVRAGRLGPAIWAHLSFNLIAAAFLIGNLGS